MSEMGRQEEVGSDLPMVGACLWSTTFSPLTRDGIWPAMVGYPSAQHDKEDDNAKDGQV